MTAADRPAHKTGRYAVREDDNGYACAIARDGIDVLHLVVGSSRNESEGGAAAIVEALNEDEHQPVEIPPHVLADAHKHLTSLQVALAERTKELALEREWGEMRLKQHERDIDALRTRLVEEHDGNPSVVRERSWESRCHDKETEAHLAIEDVKRLRAALSASQAECEARFRIGVDRGGSFTGGDRVSCTCGTFAGVRGENQIRDWIGRHIMEKH